MPETRPPALVAHERAQDFARRAGSSFNSGKALEAQTLAAMSTMHSEIAQSELLAEIARMIKDRA